MIIHIFSIMRNEEAMLPYFLRHYSLFADKIFILNDHSSDKTVDIARVNPKVEVLDFGYNRGLNEYDFSDCFRDSYKKYSRGVADWVMCVDSDEFIYGDDVVGRLEKVKKAGIKAVRPCGYNMVSKTFPTTEGQIYDECFMGVRNTLYSKTVVIDPSIDVEFLMGRHKTKLPDGLLRHRINLKLLHYKYMSESWVMNRINSLTLAQGFSEIRKSKMKERALFYFSHELENMLEKII